MRTSASSVSGPIGKATHPLGTDACVRAVTVTTMNKSGMTYGRPVVMVSGDRVDQGNTTIGTCVILIINSFRDAPWLFT